MPIGDPIDGGESDSIFSDLVPDYTESVDEQVPDHKGPEKAEKKGVSNPFSKLKTNAESTKASERPYGNTPAMPKAGLITEKVASLYVMIGMGVMMKDEVCGTAIMESAEEAAKSIEALAKANPKVRKYVLMMLETGAWSGVLMAHAPIMMAVYAHHKPGSRESPIVDADAQETPLDIRIVKGKNFQPHFQRPSTNN